MNHCPSINVTGSFAKTDFNIAETYVKSALSFFTKSQNAEVKSSSLSVVSSVNLKFF